MIFQILKDATNRLINKKISSAHLDAEVLLAFILKSSREKILAHPEKELKAVQIDRFKKILNRRTKYEPIAYIIGVKEFYGLPIKVSPKVLIPRPETELLVEKVVEYVQKINSRGSKTVILDVGTGSGCICLALRKLLPKVKIWGLELSTEALSLARQNAKNLNLNVKFKKSNLLSSFIDNLDGAIIVANLPYLDHKEIKDLPIEIKRGLSYEPAEALYAGRHGLEAYRAMFGQIEKSKTLPRAIFIEIGNIYWCDFLKLSKEKFPNADISISKDLAGNQRFIKIIF
jgi:release factor glutamine methyltransferase